MIIWTEGDGRCAFRAFSKQMNEGAPLRERAEVQQADQYRKDMLDAMSTEAVRAYLEHTQEMELDAGVSFAHNMDARILRMTPPDEYAELPEVIALSIALKRKILVLHFRDLAGRRQRREEVDYTKEYDEDDFVSMLFFEPQSALPGDCIRLFHHLPEVHFSAMRLVTTAGAPFA